MRFALTAEQRQLRDTAREVLVQLCPPAVVRAAPDSAEVDAVHRGLTELGAWGLLADESAGGLGLDENFLVPLLTEVGRAAVPLPVSDTVGFAPGVLAAAGLLADVVAGSVTCAADPDGRQIVRCGQRIGLVLSGGHGGAGPVRVLDVRAATREPVAAVDPAAYLARISGGTEVSVVDDPAVVELAWLRGVLAAAAELVGLSWRLLDLTVAHVRERRQFGVPVGSFQAVKHRMASALLGVEFAAPAVARAGFSLSCLAPDRHRDVSMAKALATDAATEMTRAAIQCHGAIAYTTEYDLHLYAKRVWALAPAWGSAAWHRAAVARSIGLTRAG